MLTELLIYIFTGLVFGELAVMGENLPGGVRINTCKYFIIAFAWPLVVLIIARGAVMRILR